MNRRNTLYIVGHAWLILGVALPVARPFDAMVSFIIGVVVLSNLPKA